jgi:hypothetical protein
MFMRKIFICFLFIICLFPTLSIANSFHYYFTGRVQEISDSRIQVEKRTFTLAPGCMVIIEQRRNDAFFRDPARVFNIHQGDLVTIQAEGSRVNEILIERWKR